MNRTSILPMILGRTFPDRTFQANFLSHLDTVYTRLPWNVSIDAANDWAPFDSLPSLKTLGLGHRQSHLARIATGRYDLAPTRLPLSGVGLVVRTVDTGESQAR